MPGITKNLQTGICRTDFDLDAQEYYAIGRVTVHWAYLEHGVFAVTAAICADAKEAVPRDALSSSFKRRLSAFRLTIEAYVGEPERTNLLRLHSQIANAEQDRHKITHAMWDFDPANPERISASSFRPGFEFEKRFDAKRINDLADRIGAITFEMEYPDGFEGFLSDFKDAHGRLAYAGISRQMLRELKAQKDQNPQDSDPSKPQGRKPPQSA